MDFNPMMLLPLLTMLNKGKGGDAQTEMPDIAGLLSKLKDGDTSALLGILPADEKTKQMLSLVQILPALMGKGGTVQTASAPPSASPNPLTVANNEINAALKKLLG